jgi:hypothetical protein
MSRSAVRVRSPLSYLSLLKEKRREASANKLIGLTAGYCGRAIDPSICCTSPNASMILIFRIDRIT